MNAALASLREAALGHTAGQARADGLVRTAIPSLRMMCVPAPSGPMHSVYRPLLCVVLQGAKQMTVGGEERRVGAGDTVIVTADVPVTGRIVQASAQAPYLAVAIEFDLALLQELAAATSLAEGPSSTRTFWVDESDEAVVDVACRLVRLLRRPEAVPILAPGLLRELHYWLLNGRHAAALRSLASPGAYGERLGRAMALLRQGYREQISVEQLAAAAGLSVSAFHRHFKTLTTLTPVQFQKQLRLVEARRLMLDDGWPASRAAFEVGYASASQFTREYGRMFGAPPRRDVRGRLSRDGSKGAHLHA